MELGNDRFAGDAFTREDPAVYDRDVRQHSPDSKGRHSLGGLVVVIAFLMLGLLTTALLSGFFAWKPRVHMRGELERAPATRVVASMATHEPVAIVRSPDWLAG